MDRRSRRLNSQPMRLRHTLFIVAALTLATLVVAAASASGPPNTIDTFAGGGSTDGASVPALDADVLPGSLAVSPDGDVYMYEYNCRIRKVSGGLVTDVAGGPPCGFGGDNGPAADAQISRPGTIGFDASGNLYVADMWNCAVRRIDAVTSIITTIAGDGVCDTGTPNDGLGIDATSAHLMFPLGIAVAANGDLYVSEPDQCRIDRVSGGVITLFAGAARVGSDCLANDGDSGPATAAHLHDPGPLALDTQGNLYVSSLSDCVIREISGATIATLTTNACAPWIPTESVYAIAIGQTGSLVLTDTNECRVRTLQGGVPQTIAGSDAPISPCGFSGDGGPAIDAKLDSPDAVALDAAGNIYIGDLFNHRVRVVWAAPSAPSPSVGGIAEAPDLGTLASPNSGHNRWYVAVALLSLLVIASTMAILRRAVSKR